MVPRNELDFEALLWAIGEKESGNQDNLVGGRYQFKEATWKQFSRMPYSYAKDPRYSIPAARDYLQWISRELFKWGFKENAYFMALAWNAGMDSLRKCITTYQEKDYAQKVENLYWVKRNTIK